MSDAGGRLGLGEGRTWPYIMIYGASKMSWWDLPKVLNIKVAVRGCCGSREKKNTSDIMLIFKRGLVHSHNWIG